MEGTALPMAVTLPIMIMTDAPQCAILQKESLPIFDLTNGANPIWNRETDRSDRPMCSICGKTTGCHTRCPNYLPAKASHCCSGCGEGIEPGEEYIENGDGEYRHYDCFYGTKELIEWLGYRVRMMEEQSNYGWN